MSALAPSLGLNPAAPKPLYRQLYERIRASILAGQLPPGSHMPPTRALAAQLGLSRTTVLAAYEQLQAEGYLVGRTGSGTTVASALPGPVPSADRRGGVRPRQTIGTVSARGRRIRSAPNIDERRVTSESQWRRAFRVGVPGLDSFPTKVWERLLARRVRRSLPRLLEVRDVAGLPALRRSIAAYLSLSRGVRCTADQVVIVAGAQGALDLAARILLDPGDAAWIEDPVYHGAHGALVSAGARVVPVPVDDDGLDVAAGIRFAPGARLAFVTPSCQFPTGTTLSLARRLALLKWARDHGAWIIEDDYDSEYRYSGRPLAALQGIDDGCSVVYIGTMSKVLFPALRLGYVVVPEALVDAFVAARRFIDYAPPALEQAVLCDFIEEGHFERHLRRMRALYAERGRALYEASRRHLAGYVELASPAAGMQAVAWLPPGSDDRAIAAAARRRRIEVRALSDYQLKPTDRSGLVLGFAAVTPRQIEQGSRQLAAAIAESSTGATPG